VPETNSTDFTTLGRAWAIGLDLVIYVVAGGLIGLVLDWVFGIGPTMLIVMALLGLAAGVLRFVREAMALNKEMAARSASRRRPATPDE
jgi:F0F1-type ATP synthase assembly protein I